MTAAVAALRDRIETAVPKIYKALKHSHPGDVRPRIIAIILEVAQLVPTMPARRRVRVKKMATDLKKMGPEFAPAVEILESIIGKPAPVGRINLRRMELAVRLVHELMIEEDNPATLTTKGPFVEITSLIVAAATGAEIGTTTALAACSRHFKVLKVEAEDALGPDWPYHRRGVTKRKDVEEARRQRLEEARTYPDLRKLIEEMVS